MKGRVWCLIAGWSAKITCRIFDNAEPIIWWALRAASWPTLSASCWRATGKRSLGSLGYAFNFFAREQRPSSWRAACSAKKESAMLRNQLVRLHRSLRALGRAVGGGRLKDTSKIERRLGRLEERYPQAWSMLSEVAHRRGSLWWSWNKTRLRGAKLRQGAYLLRTNLDPMDPDALCVNTCS